MSTNVPVTVWQATSGLVDFSSVGIRNIVDTLAVFIADPSGVFIVDTGVQADSIPSTSWSEDDSL